VQAKWNEVLSKDMASVDKKTPDLEAKAQHHKNGVSDLTSQQQGS